MLIKDFYLNKSKKYSTKELITNWFLTILQIIFLIWLSLVVLYSVNLSNQNDWYLEIKTSKVNGEIFTGNITAIIMLIIIFFPLILSEWIMISSKFDIRYIRKSKEIKENIKDLLDDTPIEKLSKENIKDIFIKLKLWNLFSKNKNLKSFSKKEMVKRIKRSMNHYFLQKEFYEYKSAKKQLKNNNEN